MFVSKHFQRVNFIFSCMGCGGFLFLKLECFQNSFMRVVLGDFYAIGSAKAGCC